jgi:hypothetical protein
MMQCTESNNDQVWRQKLSGVFSIVRDGAQFLGPIGPVESATNVPTVCGHFVIMPFGIKRRVPTCPECRANQSSQDSTAPEGKRAFQR